MQRPPMDPMQQFGIALLVMAALLALVGALLWLGGRVGLGRLPGDLHFGGEGWSCFVPVTSMLLISLVLTLIVNLISRWLK